MPLSVQIRPVKGSLAKLRRDLRQAPRRLRREVARAQDEATLYLLEQMQRQYDTKVRGLTGETRKNLRRVKSRGTIPDIPSIEVGWIPLTRQETSVRGPIGAITGTIEFGATWSKFPNIRRLQFYVSRRFGLTGRAGRRAAISIGRKLLRRGRPATPVVTAVVRVGMISNNIENVVQPAFQGRVRTIMQRLRTQLENAAVSPGNR